MLLVLSLVCVFQLFGRSDQLNTTLTQKEDEIAILENLEIQDNFLEFSEILKSQRAKKMPPL